ncbi:tRNA 2-selenouridine(34) synthase MnmH [Salibacterium halotolerans]|uniref:tRNA 2-selenouridine synthase n=1 Tax=Salibacterium halotolerans TaxID=1884432 RepID=A0A1I5RJQ7_9BACI|nr:tRNA 2-selenouridine(34) synthase MnmH [Salibacterium halotolerans]SFP58768.1 tRNA 2-selenouridine synthase [Salibacterium halotolerans]
MFEDTQFVDVRSPSEFEEYALPGAVNIPLFSDDERAHVGTIYKQQGKEQAVKEGLKITGPKLHDYYEKMKETADAAGDKEIVVYCWRGGMRSRSFVSSMQMLGIACTRLQGGIRSWRKKVIETLEQEKQSSRRYIVITGGTGTAKTVILHRLQEEGWPVIDLEGLANHRGSAFGNIGLKRKSQKQFEFDLWKRLEELRENPYVIIEGESRRIGNINLPDFLMEGKAAGTRLNVQLPMKERVQVIMETYAPESHHNEVVQAVEKIKKNMSEDVRERLEDALQWQRYEEVVENLLTYYYDPRYKKAFEQYEQEAVIINEPTTVRNLEKVRGYLQQHTARSSVKS